MTANEMKSLSDRMLTQLSSAVEVRLLALSGDMSLDDALQQSTYYELVMKLSKKQLQKIYNTLYPQLDNLKSFLARREDPSLDTFQRNVMSPMMVPSQFQNDDDPFTYTHTLDTSYSPFTRELLVIIMQMLGHSKGLFSCAAVNKYWRAAFQGDPVWEVLCGHRYGTMDTDTEAPRAWRSTYFLGACRSLMVTMGDCSSVSLPVSVGTTVKDLLDTLSVPDNVAQKCRLESDDFSHNYVGGIIERHADATECELRCAWLFRAHLHVLFANPYSVVRVEGNVGASEEEGWQSKVLSKWNAISTKAYARAPEFVRNAAPPP
jgi:hypothetical protein